MKKTFITILTLLTLFWPVFSLADSNEQLPEVMVGQTTVTQGGVDYYGGMSGNQAVLNYSNETENASGGPGQLAGKKTAASVVLNGLRNANDSTRDPVPAFSNIDCGSNVDILGEGAFSVSVWVKRDRDVPPPFDPNSWGDDVLRDPPQGQDSIMPRDFIISQGNGMYGDYYIYFNKYDQVVLRTWGYGTKPVGYGGGVAGEGMDLTSGNTKILYNDKNWHHIVVIRNADGLTGQMWIDGQDVTTYVCPGIVCSTAPAIGPKYINIGGNQSNGPHKTNIGALSWGWADSSNRPYPLKGSIDEVRTYTRALDVAEIQRIYQGTTTADEDKAASNIGLKAYWKFNEGSGKIAKDWSGHNFSCTINNSAWDNTDGAFFVDTTQYKNNGYDLFGFEQGTISSCLAGIIVDESPHRCFITNSNNKNIITMTSRTFIGSDPSEPKNEIATILYPPKPALVGDAYLGSNSLSNFAYWGRNLVQTSGTTGTGQNDTFWGITGYINAPGSRATMDLLGTEFKAYRNKITNLNNEAKELAGGTIGSTPDWWLQSSSAANFGISNNDSTLYPEGKTWKINGDLSIPAGTTITYHGKGTIIVNGDFRVNDHANLIPADDNSTLGIMVLAPSAGTTGDTYFEGNASIVAVVLCADYKNGTSPSKGIIHLDGNDIHLIGSFAARGFDSTGNINSARFYYDRRLDSSWPPGFGYLNMASSGEN